MRSIVHDDDDDDVHTTGGAVPRLIRPAASGRMPAMPSRPATPALRCILALALVGCADAPPPPLEPTVRVADAAVPVAPPTVPAVPEVFLDLVEALLAPGAPGWARVSQLADRGPWLPPKAVGDDQLSWLEGIGGTLFFAVGDEGPSLRTVEIALRPIARGQVVSIFVDEEPVTTTRLDTGTNLQRLTLPTEGLAPGEHSLRFWFRFTRYQGRKRVPAAIGTVRFLPPGDAPPLPEVPWVGPLKVAGVEGPALMAGAPAGWSYYLLPPVGGRLFARAAVQAGGPVDFVVRVGVDGEPTREAGRLTVQPGTAAELDVDLAPWQGRPIRLDLDTEGEAGPLGRAGWIEPTILMPGRPRGEVPPVRNVVLWVVDGLRSDRVGLGRGGDRAATPNIDLLAAEGAAAIEVWSGGASAADGHLRLLQPHPEGPPLAEVMAQGGRRTGLLASSSALTEALGETFQTRVDLRSSGEAPETRILLREMDAWLDVRKKHPFFLYIASDDPRVPLEPVEGYKRLYQRARPETMDDPASERAKRRELRIAYDAQLSAADYWVGQMVALLHRHGVAEDTAIVVAGTVGQELRENGGLGDGHALVPEVFQVPLVVWHPGLRNRGAPRPLTRGGDLGDVAQTVAVIAGANPPDAWGHLDLVPALFHGLPPPPMPSHARLGNQVAARFGGWLLRGAGNRELKLWNLRADPSARAEIGAERPIALRTLRDSMLDRP